MMKIKITMKEKDDYVVKVIECRYFDMHVLTCKLYVYDDYGYAISYENVLFIEYCNNR